VSWEDLRVVGIAEGASKWVDVVVGAPIVQNQSEERFVLRDPASEDPRPNIVLGREEFDQNVEQGVFIRLSRGWVARRDHVVLLLSAGLGSLAREAHHEPSSADREPLRGDWMAFHMSRTALQQFREEASAALLALAVPLLREVMLRSDLYEKPVLRKLLTGVQDLAPRGTQTEQDGAALWVLLQQKQGTKQLQAARRAARLITDLDDDALDLRLDRVRELYKIPFGTSARSGLATRSRIRQSFLSGNTEVL